MQQLLRDSLKSSIVSGLLILKYVVPFYLVADGLQYFDLLRHLGFFFAPFTSLLDLPPEAAVALAGGVLINIYAGIAFAAPLGLSPYQWTILAVFLGVCHSMIVESAIMAKLGISYGYSWILGKRWNIEATIGFGYAYSNYDKYDCATCGRFKGSQDKHYFGPTKAGISLIYIIK